MVGKPQWGNWGMIHASLLLLLGASDFGPHKQLCLFLHQEAQLLLLLLPKETDRSFEVQDRTHPDKSSESTISCTPGMP